MHSRDIAGIGISIAMLTGAFLLALLLVWRHEVDPGAPESVLPSGPVASAERSSDGAASPSDFPALGDGAVAQIRQAALPAVLEPRIRHSVDAPPGPVEMAEPVAPHVPDEELTALLERQLSDYYANISNPMTVIELPPSSDAVAQITLGELDHLHAAQMDEYWQTQDSGYLLALPESSDGVLTVNLAELSDLHERQEGQSARFDSGELVSLPALDGQDDSIVSLDELSQRLEFQTNQTTQFLANPNSLVTLPESADAQHGLTLGELDRLHSAQSASSR